MCNITAALMIYSFHVRIDNAIEISILIGLIATESNPSFEIV